MLAKFLENKKLVALIITIALLTFIIYSSLPFISAFFGAAILAFIFRPLDKWLRKKSISPKISATIILILAFIIIIIPIIFIINGLINQIALLPDQIQKLKLVKTKLSEIIPFNIDINESQIIEQLMPILTKSIQPIFENIIHAFVILFLLFFLLYFFILYYDNFKKAILTTLPFSKQNNEKIINKFKQVTNATIIGTFFIAIIQGALIAMNFYFLGIPNALFWGFVAGILSFLPIIGPPVIWVPAAIFLFLTGSINKAIALIIIGILISTIDNILRPVINQKYSSIHPLTSIIGIYIGISQFGIIGVFIGPLIVAYLVLFWRLYREEYFGK